MKPGEQRRFAVSSTADDIRMLAAFAREAISESFKKSDITSLELAIVEAANNILKHSYKFRKEYPIELTIYHNGQEMEFLFQDKGEQFDISRIKAPNFDWKDIEDVPEDGRGVFIINEIMDNIEYDRSGDINILRMTKEIHNKDSNSVQPFINTLTYTEEDVIKLKMDMKENEQAIDEMAEELSTAYESLNLFYSLSRDIALISDLNSFLDNTLEKVLVVAGADWGVVRLIENQDLVLHSMTAHCPAGTTKKRIPMDNPDSIEGKVALSLKMKIEYSYLDFQDHVLCLPIVGLDEFLGIILLGKNGDAAPFNTGNVKLTRALADQIAVSIENNRLYSKAMNVELAEKEMEIAMNLQKKLILETPPEMRDLKCYLKSEPATQVGGDYLTLYKTNEDIIYLFVSDAMGKGMSASYFSLLIHMALHSIMVQHDPVHISPGQILTLINQIMEKDFDRFGMFMTAFIGKINLHNNSLEYASAGHTQPIYYHPSHGIEFLDTSDFMLGVDADTEYYDFQVDFKPETKLLVYSDGLTDIMDETGEIAGVEPLEKICIAEFPNHDIIHSCKKIYNTIVKKSGGTLQDDMSILGIERKG